MLLRNFHPNIRIRIMTSFLTRIVGTMVFPFMAIYFADVMGATLAGLLVLSNVGVAMVAGFVGGHLGDLIGRKKMMVIAESLMLIAFIGMALANSPWWFSPWFTFVMMMLHGISSGMMNPVAEAMLIDVSTPENRRLLYTINYWAINLSIALGSLIGGLLFNTHKFELFLSLTGISLFTLILLMVKVKETIPLQREKREKKLTVGWSFLYSYRKVWADKPFVRVLLAGLCLYAVECQTVNYIAIRISNEFEVQKLSWDGWFSFQLDGLMMGSWIRLENTVLVILGAVWVSRLLKRYGDQRVLTLGILSYTVGYAVLTVSNDLIILLIAVLAFTFGELAYVPVQQTLMADLAQENLRGSYMAVRNLSHQGGKMAGAMGITLGAVIPSWGMAMIYVAVCLTGFVLFMSVLTKLRQVRQQESLKKNMSRTKGSRVLSSNG